MKHEKGGDFEMIFPIPYPIVFEPEFTLLWMTIIEIILSLIFFPGKFSQYIQLALSSEVDSVILDGEICTFNKELGVVVTKAQHDNIRKLRDDHPTLQQCLVVYDVVYYNGEVLTMKPLNERLKILKKIIPKEIPGEYNI